MKNAVCCATLGLLLVATPAPAAEADQQAPTPARELIENLNKICDHRAGLAASVRVIGKVAKPGRYEMRSTDTVWSLLERAGMDDDAATDQIVLIRRDEAGNEGRHILNWAKREEYGADPLLCEGDVVYVPLHVD